MLEKKKTSKTKILCMLLLVTAIFAGSATAYARTKTDAGKSFYGWTYKFVGNYAPSSGVVSGSTSANFIPYKGCYTEVKAYVISREKPYAYNKREDNFVSCKGNAGKNNNKIRVMHHAYNKKDTSAVGGHTLY